MAVTSNGLLPLLPPISQMCSLLCVATGCCSAVSLLFHLMLFYLQLRILIRVQTPLELLLVPFCTACWPYCSKRWINGTQHCSQTIAGSYPNINQSRLVATAAFTGKTKHATRNCFTHLSDLLCASQHLTWYSLNWSSEEKPRLSLWLLPKYCLRREKTLWATATDSASPSKDTYTTGPGPRSISLLPSFASSAFSNHKLSKRRPQQFRSTGDKGSALLLPGSVAFIERRKRFH